MTMHTFLPYFLSWDSWCSYSLQYLIFFIFLLQLHGVDDAIDKSKKVLTAMSRRMTKHKWIVGSVIGALILAIIIIIYFKLFHWLLPDIIQCFVKSYKSYYCHISYLCLPVWKCVYDSVITPFMSSLFPMDSVSVSPFSL